MLKFFLLFTLVGCFVIVNPFVGILIDHMQATGADEELDRNTDPGDTDGGMGARQGRPAQRRHWR